MRRRRNRASKLGRFQKVDCVLRLAIHESKLSVLRPIINFERPPIVYGLINGSTVVRLLCRSTREIGYQSAVNQKSNYRVFPRKGKRGKKYGTTNRERESTVCAANVLFS